MIWAKVKPGLGFRSSLHRSFCFWFSSCLYMVERCAFSAPPPSPPPQWYPPPKYKGLKPRVAIRIVPRLARTPKNGTEA